MAQVPWEAYTYSRAPHPPRTGRGHSLLSQGVESNPGPGDHRPAQDSNTPYYVTRAFLESWGLLP